MRSAMKRAARSPPGVAVPRPCMLSSARAESVDMAHAESMVTARAGAGDGRWPPQEAGTDRRSAANARRGMCLALAVVIQRRWFMGAATVRVIDNGWLG